MKNIKLFITIFVCMFLLTGVLACNNQENNNNNNQTNTPDNGDSGNDKDPNEGNPGDQNGSENQDEPDVSMVTFEDATKEYTGEALAITVKQLPGTVKVEYTYYLGGEEVKEMVEIGEYEIEAKLISKATGAELDTLTAILTIEPRHIFDEIENDADSNIKLTYETTFVQLRKDPDDQTQLIAGGLELWAAETIYFVLDDSNMPLNFLNLHEDSIEEASIVENALVISKQGTYDVIMSFPEGEMVPSILVREGKDANVFYFRTPENDQANEETALGFVYEGNTVTYEATLEEGFEFLIANYYRSVEFTYNPHFVGIEGFEAATDGYVKVLETASYKFVVNLTSKSIQIYKNGELLEVDTNILYLRGSMNEWGTSTALSKKNGIASITVDLAVNDEFKIADAGWSVQYNLSHFGSASAYFGASIDDGNIKVLQAGSYKIEIDLNNNTITVTKDGQVILDKVSAGNQGGGSQDGVIHYQIVINGSTKIDLVYDGPWNYDSSFTQYYALGVQLNAGDIITLFNVTNNEAWALTKIDPASMGGMTSETGVGITVGETGTYNIYIKMKFEQDNIYFGK